MKQNRHDAQRGRELFGPNASQTKVLIVTEKVSLPLHGDIERADIAPNDGINPMPAGFAVEPYQIRRVNLAAVALGILAYWRAVVLFRFNGVENTLGIGNGGFHSRSTLEANLQGLRKGAAYSIHSRLWRQADKTRLP